MHCEVNLEGSRDEYKRLIYYMLLVRGLISDRDVLDSFLDCISDRELGNLVCKYIINMIKDWSNKNVKI